MTDERLELVKLLLDAASYGDVVPVKAELLRKAAATLSTPSGAQQEAVAIYLVAYDDIKGVGTVYERFEGAPPPLCDYEGPLYTHPTPGTAALEQLRGRPRLIYMLEHAFALVDNDDDCEDCRDIRKFLYDRDRALDRTDEKQHG